MASLVPQAGSRGPNFELSYGLVAVLPYLKSLGKENVSRRVRTENLANERIAAHEQALMKPVLEFLTSQKGKVRILGLEEDDKIKRAQAYEVYCRGQQFQRNRRIFR